jgi:hypothetical protein
MEPFVLIIWLWTGQRLEETRIQDMGRAECVERLLTIEDDRAARGRCLGADGTIIKSWKLVPHICGVAPPCWPVHGPGNAMLPAREPH